MGPGPTGALSLLLMVAILLSSSGGLVVILVIQRAIWVAEYDDGLPVFCWPSGDPLAL